MAHNMEVVDGITSFARAECERAPWWAGMDELGEGQTFIKGADWRQVLDLANLNYEVSMHEMVTVDGDSGYMLDEDDSKIYRPVRCWKGARDGRKGLMGRGFTQRYGLVQPSDMAGFAQAVQAIMPGAYIATAGGVRNGNRCFISVRLGERVVDVNGFQDTTNLYLSILNSFDGTAPFAVANGSYRTECDNTFSGNLGNVMNAMKNAKGNRRGGFISGGNVVLRHTGDMGTKIETAKLAVAEELGWAEAYAIYAQGLANTPMTTPQFKKLVKAMVPEPKETDSERVNVLNANNYERKISVLSAEWKKETEDRGGRTAWGALNAFTALASHYSVAKGTKLTAGVELESRVFGDTNTAVQGKQLVDQVMAYLNDHAMAKV